MVSCLRTTGEGATLRPEEHALVIETTVAVAAGRVPVIAGCGTNDTRTTIEGRSAQQMPAPTLCWS
jgi:4-hydroxy-tetrahydrodipicolinate synthase